MELAMLVFLFPLSLVFVSSSAKYRATIMALSVFAAFTAALAAILLNTGGNWERLVWPAAIWIMFLLKLIFERSMRSELYICAAVLGGVALSTDLFSTVVLVMVCDGLVLLKSHSGDSQAVWAERLKKTVLSWLSLLPLFFSSVAPMSLEAKGLLAGIAVSMRLFSWPIQMEVGSSKVFASKMNFDTLVRLVSCVVIWKAAGVMEPGFTIYWLLAAGIFSLGAQFEEVLVAIGLAGLTAFGGGMVALAAMFFLLQKDLVTRVAAGFFLFFIFGIVQLNAVAVMGYEATLSLSIVLGILFGRSWAATTEKKTVIAKDVLCALLAGSVFGLQANLGFSAFAIDSEIFLAGGAVFFIFCVLFYFKKSSWKIVLASVPLPNLTVWLKNNSKISEGPFPDLKSGLVQAPVLSSGLEEAFGSEEALIVYIGALSGALIWLLVS